MIQTGEVTVVQRYTEHAVIQVGMCLCPRSSKKAVVAAERWPRGVQ